VDFLNEWSLEEDNLSMLREREARAELTREQQARYEQVLEIVTRNRPIIARLMDGITTRT
jgi:type II secretory pathway component GspD/PulD (secretin)